MPSTWTGWRQWAAWGLCFSLIVLLGLIRALTNAELAFASLALLPVVGMSWLGGRRSGYAMTLLATVMWIVADLASGHQFDPAWIPWLNAVIRLVTYGLVVLFVAQVRSQFDREREHATRDALTGLHNRRAFVAAGSSEVERARRYKRHLAIIFLDLDNFKNLNDTKGHHVGDAALQATAGGLVSATRANDFVARLGGDEFAVLLPEIGFDSAVSVGQKIFAEVNHALDEFAPTRASIGVAWFEEVERAFPAMRQAADELMYEVKAGGKNNILSRRFPEKSISRD